MSTIWEFDNLENKHTLYHAEDCMKTFRSSLRKHAGNVISFENKEMLQLSKKLLKLHDDAKTCYICEKKYAKDESY